MNSIRLSKAIKWFVVYLKSEKYQKIIGENTDENVGFYSKDKKGERRWDKRVS